MKLWSRKSQSSKPDSTSELLEPKFVKYKSCYYTNYSNGYSDFGPYGDPLPPYSTSLDYGEEGFGFSNKYWNENELNDQLYGNYGNYGPNLAYENFQLPYGGGNWVGEYETYIVGGWGENMFSGGYGSLDEERGPQFETKMEGDEGGRDSYFSYDGGMQMEYPTYEDSCWFGFWEDYEGFYGNDGLKENEDSLNGFKGLDEIKLCESIFGYWTCLEQGFA